MQDHLDWISVSRQPSPNPIDPIAKRSCVPIIVLAVSLLLGTSICKSRPARQFHSLVRLEFSDLSVPKSTSEETTPIAVAGLSLKSPAGPGVNDAFKTALVEKRSGREVAASDLGILSVPYNLPESRDRTGGVAIRKPVFAEGVRLGLIDLRILDDRRILVDAERFSEVLSAAKGTSAAITHKTRQMTSFVDIDELRAAGLEIRYDPVRDSLVLGT